MTYQPTTVTTIDGRQVLSDSTEWMCCCEAVYTLGKTEGGPREAWLADVEKKRGAAGRDALQAEMDRIEPAYLLAMGGKDERRAYLSRVKASRGDWVRQDLERRLVSLWESRKAAQP